LKLQSGNGRIAQYPLHVEIILGIFLRYYILSMKAVFQLRDSLFYFFISASVVNGMDNKFLD
jgi:hypothetical protein